MGAYGCWSRDAHRECAHQSRTGHKSRPEKIGMRPEPGNRARSPSRDHGERHGRTFGWPMTKRRMRVRTIGPLQHLNLERETDIMRVIALRISPPEMQRCLVALYLPTRCRVPSSAHDLPRLSPVGTNVGTKPDAHRIGSRAPLGLALRAAELQVCIPMVCPISQTAGRPLPAYPFPLAGRLSVSLHTLVHGRLTGGKGTRATTHAFRERLTETSLITLTKRVNSAAHRGQYAVESPRSRHPRNLRSDGVHN